MKKYKVRVTWANRPDLSSVVEVEDEKNPKDAVRAAFGMSGEFYFEQGGRGTMGHPTDAEIVE